ncbi:hypothetical protein VB715_17700 [Crocosphaera sp. UHCC 0190]|uniref:hypothetical protein n=1 Tax=Crocosphaera sp. UHCC 0190 TaxID=3110246 RepID=UPI002B21DC32|nr:hypothetical protein [Crocosphaera sp. UHCC 0190]MEA5511611.1 hypothetical protein [Crocosphaera sp. UHCC 0190]
MAVDIISAGKIQENTREKTHLFSPYFLKNKVDSFLKKELINPEIILKHNHAFEKTRTLKILAQALDHQRFREQDFIWLIQIRNKFTQGLGEYQGLNAYLRLFRVAIEAKNSFLSIEQIELLYRSSKQQNFYHLVFQLLERDVSKESFYQLIHQELTESLPKIKTEKGKKALECYVQSLDSLTYKDDLGLKLLYLFKKYQLTNYSILQKVSNIVDYLKNRDIKNTATLVKLVKKEGEVFDQLGKILEIPPEKNSPLTYATMLQYIVLQAKYGKVYSQFEKLMEVLGEWNKSYKTVESIRRQYSWTDYQQPKDFKQKLETLDLHKKYRHYC